MAIKIRFSPCVVLFGCCLFLFDHAVPQCSGGWQNTRAFSQKAEHYHDVQAFDSVTAYAVGDSGTFLRLTSGNALSNRQLGVTNAKLSALHFVDRQTGWVAGANGVIIHTNDSGKSWQSQNTNVKMDLLDIHFADSLHGWAVGKQGSLLHTSNGGQSWRQQNIASQENFQAVEFKDSLNGWFCGTGGTMFHTSDGGKSWSRQSTGTQQTLNDLSFTAKQGWAVGSGVVLKTTNGGDSWQKLNTTVLDSIRAFTDFTSVAFVSEKKGWILSDCGERLTTNDGGVSWNYKVIFPSFEFDCQTSYSFDFANSQHAFAIGGGNSLIQTSDGGQSWKFQFLGSGINAINSLYFLDRGSGWLAAEQGLFRTNSGGKSWTYVSDTGLSGLNYQDVYFTDSGHGWAVSFKTNLGQKEGSINHSSDSGKTWKTQKKPRQKPATANLNDIHFENPSLGWVVGNQTLLHTSNGGANWERQVPKKFTDRYFEVYFHDKQQGWAAGFHIPAVNPGIDEYTGFLRKTENGGQKWQKVKEVPGNGFRSVHFSNANHGWAVGDTLIVHSTDGGQNWHIQDSSFTGFLNTVYAIDTNRAWAAGTNGTLLHTYNGGKSWHKHNVNTKYDIMDLQFLNATTGWAAGDSGLFMKYKQRKPHATFEYQRQGSQVQFYNTSINDSFYRWHFGEGTTSQKPRPKKVFDSNGIYKVCLVAQNSCGSDTFCRELTITNTGFRGNKGRVDLQLEVFPNPVTQKATFRYQLQQGRPVSLSIVDGKGKVVLRKDLGARQAGKHQQKINMSGLRAGSYYYRFKAGTYERQGKLVKEGE